MRSRFHVREWPGGLSAGHAFQTGSATTDLPGASPYAWQSQPGQPAPIPLCRGRRNDTGASPHAAMSDVNRTYERYTTRSAVEPQAHDALWTRANLSCGDGKPQRVGAGRHFPVLDFFG